MTSERVLRAAAVLVALAAVVDPAFLRSTQVRPTVVVAHATASDRDLAARVAATLESTFAISRQDIAGAAAYVLAGSDVPEGWRPPREAVVFAVTSGPGVGVRVLDLKVPVQVSIDSVAPVEATVSIDGSGDREVTVALLIDGLRLQEVKARVTGEDTRVTVPLTFVPARPGLARVRVEASATGRGIAVADAVLDVTARVWRVLVFDGRPTYAATFVRRALETDSRFHVTTRIVTSRASAVQTGPAPVSLTDTRALDAFDLVVVGAADALGAGEAASLERYLRERHGAVILLPEGTDDPVLFRLTGQEAWQEDRRAEPVRIDGGDGFTASEFFWPARWPPLVTPLATFGQAAPSAVRKFPVWQMPVGSGRVVVSSALDAWRGRASAAIGFSAFWRSTAAAVANATPPLVSVTLARRVLLPGQLTEVGVLTFSGGAPTARMRATSGAVSAVRLWPSPSPAARAVFDWQSEFRAPDMPGRYQLEVTTEGGASGAAELLVVGADGDADAWVAPASDGDGLAAMAASAHRGGVVPEGQLSALPAQLAAALKTAPVQQPWRPMRSVWWLIPFAACAAGEWWLRRRRGQR
ncbi:MAG: hypothetical protein EXQ49_08155 [Acidobacteria bacterium]|nr:hypothetical protein [Acidobacteriota bacterium]